MLLIIGKNLIYNYLNIGIFHSPSNAKIVHLYLIDVILISFFATKIDNFSLKIDFIFFNNWRQIDVFVILRTQLGLKSGVCNGSLHFQGS